MIEYIGKDGIKLSPLMLKIILFLNYIMNKKCNFTDFVHYTI